MSDVMMREAIQTAGNVLLGNYRQQPVVMHRGQGVELWDTAGNRYLDMTGGIAVNCLGHSHPRLVEGLQRQVASLLHVSNLYFIEQQIEAANMLANICFADRFYFCNSGAEANEAALKLARRFQSVVKNKPNKQRIVSTYGSFHGRTVATLSVTGQEKYHKGFGSLWGPVSFVPFGDAAAAVAEIEKEDVAAFIVEPIQAEGGIRVAPKGYLQAIRHAATQAGTILIFDEVQTGIGRTGSWFAHEFYGVLPDVITMAKALGGGVPIGAMGVSDEVAQGLSFIPGGAVPHATTFGGNPLACAAARIVLSTIQEEGLLSRCTTMGDYLATGLQQFVRTGVATEVRGRGLLCGIALSEPAAPYVHKAREYGLLLSVAGGNVIRFVPPLIVEKPHIDEALEILEKVVA